METPQILDVHLDDEDFNQGIQFINFVKSPAIEENFIALSAEAPIQLASQKDKQYVTGAVLVPGKLIPRRNNTVLRFSADSIEKIRNKFHQNGNVQETNIEHGEEMVKTNLIESWIKTDAHDKSVALGLGEQPVGTWFATYYIPSATDWTTYVLSKQCEGFSIEGILSHVEAKLAEEVPVEEVVSDIDTDIKQLMQQILNKLND